MITLDQPQFSVSSSSQAVLIQSASNNNSQHSSTDAKNQTMGFCYAVFNPKNANGVVNRETNLIEAAGVADIYIFEYLHKNIRPSSENDARLITPPAHGKIVVTESKDANGQSSSYYVPDDGYSGDDHALFRVKTEAGDIDVYTLFKVYSKNEEGKRYAADFCTDTGVKWKISSTLPTITYSNLLVASNYSNTK